MRIIVVGGGVFGLTAAVELATRGHAVTLLDPGPLPHPLAESTDISKVVRIDYGADAEYTQLGEAALEGWRSWNEAWPRPLFHETGVTFLSRTAMEPGSFEHDSYELLVSRGHPLHRLNATDIAAWYPAYRPGALVDGYFNPIGGWAESGAVIAKLVAEARMSGVTIIANRAVERITDTGVDDLVAELVIVCAGAWVPLLVPELASSITPNGQPIFHLRPAEHSVFEAARFPVFGADISRTGYYGFPITGDGIVKIANHGAGVPGINEGDLAVGPDQEAALRMFLRTVFPSLADSPIVHRRICVYADTLDGHFWIAPHPDRPNLVVATGGSGHAFKFAPVLGAMIADIALGVPHPLAHKFRWRPELATSSRGDAARHAGR